MRVLVTGGAGFVGVNLARRLILAGHDLRCFDNFTTGRRRDAELAGYAEIIDGDVTDQTAIRAALSDGVDAVVHLAAQSGVPASIQDPWYDCQQNVLGTLAVLMAARDAEVRRVVAASSAAPLGGEGYPANELCLARPLSPYGASKTALEAYCSAFSGSFGLSATALRFSNLYGPFSYHKGSVVAHYMKSVLDGRPLQINGDGTQTRDFCFIDDLCDGVRLTLETPSPGTLYQLGSGHETSIVRLVKLIGETFGEPVEVFRAPALSGEVPRSLTDPALAREELGYAPVVSLAEGLERTRAWFEEEYGTR